MSNLCHKLINTSCWFLSKLLINKILLTEAIVWIMICWIPLCSWLTCSYSIPNSNVIFTNQARFLGYTNTYTHNIISGPISNSLYYLFYVSTPNNAAIRKLNPDETLDWMVVLAFLPLLKSLSVDPGELYFYVGAVNNPLDVVRMQTSSGGIVSSQRQ